MFSAGCGGKVLACLPLLGFRIPSYAYYLNATDLTRMLRVMTPYYVDMDCGLHFRVISFHTALVRFAGASGSARVARTPGAFNNNEARCLPN